MRKSLAIHWLILIALSGATMASFFFYTASSSRLSIPVVLEKGYKFSAKITRSHAANLDAALVFEKTGEKLPQVGRLPTTLLTSKGVLEIREPGEPVTISVKTSERSVTLQALPNTANPKLPAQRNLVQVPRSQAGTLSSGRNEVHFELVDVGLGLLGERAVLVINPPTQYALKVPGIRPITTKLLWPVLSGFLGVYAALLLIWQFRERQGFAPIGTGA